MQSTCSIEGCERKLYARAYCSAHYANLTGVPRPCVVCDQYFTARRGVACSVACGNVASKGVLPLAIRRGDPAEIIAALKKESVLDAETGCWVWVRRLDLKGYGRINGHSGRSTAVHRIALEAKLRRPLGVEQAHHVCANKSCVNPDHLEPTSLRENVAEMMQRRYFEARITELEQALRSIDAGHPLLYPA